MPTISLDILARDLASGTVKRFGTTVESTGKGLTGMQVAQKGAGLAAAGLAVGLAKSITLAKDYDLTIRQVGVQTGQSGQQLKGMSALAMQMGKDTKFSAQDAAGAMLELAKGGLSAAQIKAGALKTTMTLAAAGGLDLASAAGYVTQGMNTFGLSADQAAQVATSLAGGANASTASVDSLGQALSQVGPGAKNAGLSIQETVAALSLFDNAGIKGSDAGTSLKTMLASLAPTTKRAINAMEQYGLYTYDAANASKMLSDTGLKANAKDYNEVYDVVAKSLIQQGVATAGTQKLDNAVRAQLGSYNALHSSFVNTNGSYKDLTQVAGILQRKLSGLSESQRNQALNQIFGSDATRAATVLMNAGAKGVDKMTAATKNQHTVQKMANTSMQGAAGAWEQFKGSIETVGIQVGTKLLPAFTHLVNEATPLVNRLGDLVNVVDDLPGPVKSLAVEAAIAAVVLPRLNSALGMIGGGAGTGLAKLQQFRAELTYTETRGRALAGALNGLKNPAGIAGMTALADSAHRSSGALQTLESVGGGALLGFSAGGPIGAAIGGASMGLLSIWRAAHKAGDGFGFTKGQAHQLAGTLDEVTGKATSATRAMIIASHAKEIALAAKTGVSGATIADAIVGDAAAQARVRAGIEMAKRSIADLKTEAAKPVPGRSPAQAEADRVKFVREIKAAEDQLRALQSVAGDTSSFDRMSAKQRILYTSTHRVAELMKAGFPKQIATEIRVNGVDHSMAAVRDLARQYNATPKQIQTIARMAGYDLTMQQARAIFGAVHAIPGTKGINVAASVGGALGGISAVARALAALHDRTVFVRTVHKGITAAASAGAGAGGRGAANERTLAGDMDRSIDDAERHIKAKSVNLGKAGEHLLLSLVHGIDKHKVKAKNAVDKIKDYVDRMNDALQQAKDTQNSFAEGFSGVGSSIFNDQLPEDRAQTINDLLASQYQKTAQATAYQSDVGTVIAGGLSQDYVKQLQASGQAGVTALHTLATQGNAAVYAQLNTLNAQAAAAYSAAGQQAGQYVYGAATQIAQQQADQANKLLDAINGLNLKGELKADGSTLVAVIKADRKKKGKKDPFD